MNTYKVDRYFIVFDTLTITTEGDEESAVVEAMNTPMPSLPFVTDANEWSGFNVTKDNMIYWFDCNGEPY